MCWNGKKDKALEAFPQQSSYSQDSDSEKLSQFWFFQQKTSVGTIIRAGMTEPEYTTIGISNLLDNHQGKLQVHVPYKMTEFKDFSPAKMSSMYIRAWDPMRVILMVCQTRSLSGPHKPSIRGDSDDAHPRCHANVGQHNIKTCS